MNDTNKFTPHLIDLRNELDRIDNNILNNLTSRQKCVEEIAQLKLDGKGPIQDGIRESEILERLRSIAATEGLDSYFVMKLYCVILAHSVRIQEEKFADAANPSRTAGRILRIAFQGTEGAFSSIAAQEHFSAQNARFEAIGYETFSAMLEAVSDGLADYAMLPLENSTAGSINEAYDLLAQMDLKLVGEEVLRVVRQTIQACFPTNTKRGYSYSRWISRDW